MQLVLYIASILGAVSLLLMMPKRGRDLTLVGALLGAATLGGAWLGLWSWGRGEAGAFPGEMAYYYLFSFIAIAAAARVITHTRPVYSALWFVMVVLASAGLFVTLSAQFMAFAMIIIYAGAILVTYMFVIMLATQAEDPDFTGEAGEGVSEYDHVAHEPVAASAAGFLLLAVLLTASFEPMEPNPAAVGLSDEVLAATVLEGRDVGPSLPSPLADTTPVPTATNLERIGVDLFMGHPLGLELAGVILLMSLIGAVVIARIRIGEEDDDASDPDNVPVTREPVTGATTRPTHEPGPHEPEAIGEVGGRLGT